MKRFFQPLLNLLLPPTCLACDTSLLHAEQHLCTTCLATLPSAELTTPINTNTLMQKFYGYVPFQHAFALYYFAKQSRIQKLLHNLKYRHQPHALRHLGTLLAQTIHIPPGQPPIDLIIPIPLHPKRYHTRRYNQSALLAQSIAHTLQTPILPHALTRTVHTPTQTSQARHLRWDNVAHAFTLSPTALPYIQGQHILLVDDLVTTGATMTACAQHLLHARAHTLSFATLAIAS